MVRKENTDSPYEYSSKEWLRGQSPDFVACRGLGHSWKISYAGTRRLILECSSCETAREDTYNSLGGLDSRHYTYAEGYQRKKNTERPSTGEVRLEICRRFKSMK